MPIVNFKDPLAERLFRGERVGKGFPADLIRATRRKLGQLNDAGSLQDLRQLPGARLEALKGDLIGRHSIRVNDQFRLVFVWTEAGAAEVRFIDYH